MSVNKKVKKDIQKQQKPESWQYPEPKIDSTWSPVLEQDMHAGPIVKKCQLYKNAQGQIVGSYLAYLLEKQKIIDAQSTLSFFNFEKNTYTFGFTLASKIDQNTEKNQKEETNPIQFILKNDEQKFIKPSFIKDNTVFFFQLKLYIKVRNKKKSLVLSLLEEQKINPEKSQKEKGFKEKEKKVGEMLQRVALWRKFFTGFHDQNGKYQEIGLEDAAKLVDVPKKTLDDYLLQIRHGKKLGFDFNTNIEAKVGMLRKFIRDKKQNMKILNGSVE